MNLKAKAARVHSALTMLTEVIEDLELAEEPELVSEAQALQKKINVIVVELKGDNGAAACT